MSSGYSTATPVSICPSVAYLYRDVSSTSTLVGVSRGGLTLTADVEITNVEFDGKRAPIEGLDYISFRNCKISGTLIEVSNSIVQTVLEPGSSSTTATTGVVTVTPKAASTLFTANTDYLANVKYQFTRADAKVISYNLAQAICTKWTVKSSDKDVIMIDVEIEARLDATTAASSTDTSPYTITIT